MGMIFYGLMFLMLELTMKISGTGVIIGVLPDVLGYVLLLFGLQKLKSNSHYFSRSITFSVGMIPPTAIQFGIGVMGAASRYSIIAILLGVLCTIGRGFVTFWIIRGFRDMEVKDDVDLHGTQLWWMWLCYIVISVIVLPVDFLGSVVPTLGAIAELAVLITGLCFMVFFYRTMHAFDDTYEFQ